MKQPIEWIDDLPFNAIQSAAFADAADCSN